MDDLQALLAEIRELVRPEPKRCSKWAVIAAALLLIFPLIKFIVEWHRVPTMPKMRESDVGTLGE